MPAFALWKVVVDGDDAHDSLYRRLLYFARAVRDVNTLFKTALRPGAPRFLSTFALSVAFGLASVFGAHLFLAHRGWLPPPTYVATTCIDQKIDFLSRRDLSNVNFIAAGSSATLRNLDMTVFRDDLGVEPMNTAPCFIHVDQTAYMTHFLAPRMPKLETVLIVVLPRDFAQCERQSTEFFDPKLTNAVFDGHAPHWLPYITGFRPMYLARYIMDTRKGISDAPHLLKTFDDGFGSGVFTEKRPWSPDLSIDARCFDALSTFEKSLNAQNLSLVVAIAPVSPTWIQKVDPDQTRLRQWQENIRAALSPDSLLISSWPEAVTEDYFSDTQHLIHPHEKAFSAYIADAIAAESNDR